MVGMITLALKMAKEKMLEENLKIKNGPHLMYLIFMRLRMEMNLLLVDSLS
jgi:hypothetical protein